MFDRWETKLNHPGSRIALALGWTTLVLTLTLLPGNNPLIDRTHVLFGGTDLSDATGHVLLWGFLAMFYYRVLRLRYPIRQAVGMAMLIVMAIGVATEIAQGFVPDRGPSIFDVAADWLGAGTFYVWLRRQLASSDKVKAYENQP